MEYYKEQPRIAFYPCCARDIREPIQLLQEFVDIVFFCDIDRRLAIEGPRLAQSSRLATPAARFLCLDARDAVANVDHIDVLFYRRDGSGEGGSALWVLGDSFLPDILSKFPPAGGTIITDGSNSRGALFKRMIRRTGLHRHGWHMKPHETQPFLDEHGLWFVDVKPDTEETETTQSG